MKRLIFLISLLTLLFSVGPGFPVQAEDNVGYSVQANLPDNQQDNSISYFDLRIEPEKEQELTVTVYNHEQEDLTVRAHIYDASTNSNGMIVYEKQEEIDSSLTEPISELVTLEKEEWEIPAGQSETITAVLHSPEKEFDGIKLGGIHIEKIMDEPEPDEPKEGVNIENKYAYVVGLTISENDQKVDPELELFSVEPELINYRTGVVAKVQNTKPILMEDVTIEAEVYTEDSDEPIKGKVQENISMAPNSTMDFVVDWNNEPLEAGTYRLNLTATDGENKWEWLDKFTISKEEERLNENAVEIANMGEANQSGWYITGIAGLLVIVFVLILYIGRLKKKSS